MTHWKLKTPRNYFDQFLVHNRQRVARPAGVRVCLIVHFKSSGFNGGAVHVYPDHVCHRSSNRNKGRKQKLPLVTGSDDIDFND